MLSRQFLTGAIIPGWDDEAYLRIALDLWSHSKAVREKTVFYGSVDASALQGVGERAVGTVSLPRPSAEIEESAGARRWYRTFGMCRILSVLRGAQNQIIVLMVIEAFAESADLFKEASPVNGQVGDVVGGQKKIRRPVRFEAGPSPVPFLVYHPHRSR